MGFTPSAKMIARKRDIDIASLIDILSYRRPHRSEGEQEFINVVLDTIDGMMSDEIGNRYIRVPRADGSQSNVLWSCHTDTVHGPIKDGVIRQNLKWDPAGNILGLNQGKSGQCLGADDGAGLWLLLEMLKAGKPGLYIFHAGEERGGIGSRWLEKNTPELLDGIDYAIAFDRKDLHSVITFQGGTRCCSDAFGNALGAALSRIDGLTMKLDTGGSFTDTAVYTDLVAECTNVSVGYYGAHGPRETLDVRHMIRMRDALLQLDTDVDLVKERVAGDRESLWKGGYYGGGSTYYYGSGGNGVKQQPSKHGSQWGTTADDDNDAYQAWLEEMYPTRQTAIVPAVEDDKASMFQTMLRMVKQFPETAVRMLIDLGADQWDFADTVLVESYDKRMEQGDADQDLVDAADHRVKCENCEAKIEPHEIDDDRCPFCYASLSDPIGEALAAQEKANA